MGYRFVVHPNDAPPAPSFDVSVHYHGSVCLVEPLTTLGQEWINENVYSESWQWFGNALACEPRMVAGLVAGMSDDGLNVEV